MIKFKYRFSLVISEFETLQQALQNWQYNGFTLSGVRKQGGYVELEAEHPDHKNLLTRGRTLEAAIEGLERQIDTMYGKQNK